MPVLVMEILVIYYLFGFSFYFSFGFNLPAVRAKQFFTGEFISFIYFVTFRVFGASEYPMPAAFILIFHIDFHVLYFLLLINCGQKRFIIIYIHPH